MLTKFWTEMRMTYWDSWDGTAGWVLFNARGSSADFMPFHEVTAEAVSCMRDVLKLKEGQEPSNEQREALATVWSRCASELAELAEDELQAKPREEEEEEEEEEDPIGTSALPVPEPPGRIEGPVVRALRPLMENLQREIQRRDQEDAERKGEQWYWSTSALQERFNELNDLIEACARRDRRGGEANPRLGLLVESAEGLRRALRLEHLPPNLAKIFALCAEEHGYSLKGRLRPEVNSEQQTEAIEGVQVDPSADIEKRRAAATKAICDRWRDTFGPKKKVNRKPGI